MKNSYTISLEISGIRKFFRFQGKILVVMKYYSGMRKTHYYWWCGAGGMDLTKMPEI